jgi:Domain of unknown function (DUF4372)/Transposase DDE domain
MVFKDIEKKFVGQPIFKQLVDFILKNKFDLLAKNHQTDLYYKAFPAWTQLVTMLFGVFSRCDSMGEICDGMLAMQGKLNHSEAKLHDKNFIQYLNLPAFSMIVFDRAYNDYLQFAKFTQKKINFVCRLKSNAVYEVVQELFCQTQADSGFGVLKEEHIHLKYKEENQEKTLCFRKVTYQDDKGRVYEFITNNFEKSNQEVALIYKIRWQIELIFKKLKQNFQLHYFYSETENGIKTQIWITLIAQLLLMVLKTKSKTKKAFSTVAALVRIHLISNLDVFWVIENSRRTYTKRLKKIKPLNIQMQFF